MHIGQTDKLPKKWNENLKSYLGFFGVSFDAVLNLIHLYFGN